MGRFDLKIQEKLNGGITQESWDAVLPPYPEVCSQPLPTDAARQSLLTFPMDVNTPAQTSAS